MAILGILVTSRAPSPRMVPIVNSNVTRVLKRHAITFMAVQYIPVGSSKRRIYECACRSFMEKYIY